MIIAIGGRPGSGKTTLANTLAAKFKYSVISRDDVFSQLFDLPNPHSSEHKLLAFKECLRRTKDSVQKGGVAILDLPFSRNSEIFAVFKLSRALNTEIRFFYLQCPEAIARQRIHRQKYHLVKPELRINTRTEPLPLRHPLIIIDSSPPLQQYLQAVEEEV